MQIILLTLFITFYRRKEQTARRNFVLAFSLDFPLYQHYRTHGNTHCIVVMLRLSVQCLLP